MLNKKDLIVIVADSARPDVLEKLLKDGLLPHIKKHIIDRGTYRRALSVFPTTTGPAHLPFLTGMHPGNVNIPGYRWIDREAICRGLKNERKFRSYNSMSGLRYYRDMHPSVKTLYEYYKEPAILLEPVNQCRNTRLKNPVFGRVWRMLLAHYTHYWRPVDKYVKKKLLSLIKKGYDCITAVFLGIDEYAHLKSPFDEKTKRSYIEIDKAIGEVCDLLKKKGRYDNTIIAIVSDHGHTATHTHIPLVKILKENNFNPIYFPSVYKKSFDSAVMESGNGMAFLYFSVDGSWDQRPCENQLISKKNISIVLNKLINHKGISFIAMRTEQGIVINGKKGKLYASFHDDDSIVIKIIDQNPIGGNVTNGVVSKIDILKKTFNDKYPDAVNQLLMLFKSKRAGDVLISSEPGYDLRKEFEHPEHKSSHGSLYKEHMQVPFAVNLKLKEDMFSTLDVFPTLLNAAGFRITDEIDGRILT